MLNRHRPGEITHTCLLAAQNMTSQNLYEFFFTVENIDRPVLSDSCVLGHWRRATGCAISKAAGRHGGPALVQGQFIWDLWIKLQLDELTSGRCSFPTVYHSTYVDIKSSIVWGMTNGGLRGRGSKKHIYPQTELESKKIRHSVVKHKGKKVNFCLIRPRRHVGSKRIAVLILASALTSRPDSF